MHVFIEPGEGHLDSLVAFIASRRDTDRARPWAMENLAENGDVALPRCSKVDVPRRQSGVFVLLGSLRCLARVLQICFGTSPRQHQIECHERGFLRAYVGPVLQQKNAYVAALGKGPDLLSRVVGQCGGPRLQHQALQLRQVLVRYGRVL